jgi:hypothetical protein
MRSMQLENLFLAVIYTHALLWLYFHNNTMLNCRCVLLATCVLFLDVASLHILRAGLALKAGRDYMMRRLDRLH